jgi:fructokinase
MVLMMGEAILDFIARDADIAAFESALGGSSFNTALALGRLGIASGFAGALSRDVHGQRFVRACQLPTSISIFAFEARRRCR